MLKHTMRRWTLLAFVILFVSGQAQETDPGILTLERIFASKEFESERFGPVRWLEDGSGYTTLERTDSGDDARNIVKVQPKSGEKEILVSSDKLIPEGLSNPITIEDYIWSHDGKKLLIFTNTRRVWRRNTRGDYWVLNLKSGALEQLGRSFYTGRCYGFKNPFTTFCSKSNI